jgi:hypothetical protein
MILQRSKDFLKKYKKKRKHSRISRARKKTEVDSGIDKRVKRKAKRKKPATQIAHEIQDEVEEASQNRTARLRLKEAGKQFLVIEKEGNYLQSRERSGCDLHKTTRIHNREYALFVDEKLGSWIYSQEMLARPST